MKNIESVVFKLPVKMLIKYREFDREIEKKMNFGFLKSTNIDDLETDITKNGILNPLELMVYQGKILLCEGNYRLAVAIRMGIKELPVVFKIMDRITPYIKKRINKFK